MLIHGDITYRERKAEMAYMTDVTVDVGGCTGYEIAEQERCIFE